MTMLQISLRDKGAVMSTVIALLLFCNTMFASLAPSVIALADDGSAESVRGALFATLAVSYLGSFLLNAALGLVMRADNQATAAKNAAAVTGERRGADSTQHLLEIELDDTAELLSRERRH
jgi:hypothetical protein